MLLSVPVVSLILELIWVLTIKYPPSLEQTTLGLTDFSQLWLIRGISLIFLALSIWLISSFLNKASRKYFIIISSIIPAYYLVVLSHPWDSLKLFLITIILIGLVNFTGRKIFTIILIIIFTIIVNLFIFKEKPGILEDFSIKKSQEEVTLRFNIEDSKTPHIKLPLFVRRAGYNKYFVVLKNASQEIVNFWDTETLFFQEVHPLGQKAFVVFYWPYIFLFFISLYFLKTKFKLNEVNFNWNLFVLLSIAIAYYLTSSAATERRHLFTAMFLTYLFSETLVYLIKNKFNKIILTVLFLLVTYGWLTNIYDRFVRPDYWLDNKPIAYGFAFQTIKDSNLDLETIYFSETLYAAKSYCPFYLDSCDNIHIADFSFPDKIPDKNAVFVGFTGNFLGLNSSGYGETEVKNNISGWAKVFGTMQVMNNIASGYGQIVVVAKPNK
jgi:hypothetical protein